MSLVLKTIPHSTFSTIKLVTALKYAYAVGSQDWLCILHVCINIALIYVASNFMLFIYWWITTICKWDCYHLEFDWFVATGNRN